jgi:hypothetical protein
MEVPNSVSVMKEEDDEAETRTTINLVDYLDSRYSETKSQYANCQ